MKKILTAIALLTAVSTSAFAGEKTTLSTDYNLWTSKGYKLISTFAQQGNSGGSDLVMVYLNPNAENGKQVIICGRDLTNSSAPQGSSSCYFG